MERLIIGHQKNQILHQPIPSHDFDHPKQPCIKVIVIKVPRDRVIFKFSKILDESELITCSDTMFCRSLACAIFIADFIQFISMTSKQALLKAFAHCSHMKDDVSTFIKNKVPKISHISYVEETCFFSTALNCIIYYST